MTERDLHLEWQLRRASSVSGPAGNLALVSYQPVSETPTACEQLGVEVWRASEDGVWVLPLSERAVSIDGIYVVGKSMLTRLQSDGKPLLASERYSADAFSLGGTDFELRIYDTEAPNLTAFSGIDTWPYDPALAVRGHLQAHPGDEFVPWTFTREADTGHTKRVPGILTVEVQGEVRDLVVFLDSGVLVLVFADGATGSESYAPGRFLRIDPPNAEGFVDVDFNRAFVPPCGFSDFYSCPIPPPANRFSVPIRGGERAVVWKDGRTHLRIEQVDSPLVFSTPATQDEGRQP